MLTDCACLQLKRNIASFKTRAGLRLAEKEQKTAAMICVGAEFENFQRSKSQGVGNTLLQILASYLKRGEVNFGFHFDQS